jgi:hypothetical protein
MEPARRSDLIVNAPSVPAAQVCAPKQGPAAPQALNSCVCFEETTKIPLLPGPGINLPVQHQFFHKSIVRAPARLACFDAPSSTTTSHGGPGGVVAALTGISQVTLVGLDATFVPMT